MPTTRKKTKEGYVVTTTKEGCPTEKLTLTYTEDIKNCEPYIIDRNSWRVFLNTFSQLIPPIWLFNSATEEHAALSLIAENIPEVWFRNHVAVVRHMSGHHGRASYPVGSTVITRTVEK